MLFGGLQDEITQSELELRAEQMMELSRISDEELEKVNDDKSSIWDLAQMIKKVHQHQAELSKVPTHLNMAEECHVQEVHYMVKYRDMAGQECKHGPMDMVNDFKLLGWENKVTEWDDWTGAMTLLCLQEVDRASKRGQTQSTQSMASKYVPIINQIKENGIEEMNNLTTRAQPSNNNGVKDRRVLFQAALLYWIIAKCMLPSMKNQNL